MAGSGLFVMLLPIILPTAIVSGVYYASRKAVRRAGRRDTEDVLPQLVFARREPAMWKCSKCGKQYVLKGEVTMVPFVTCNPELR